MTTEISCAAATTTVCGGTACRETHTAERAACRVASGYRLCPRCQAGLRSALRNLPALYEECGLLLTGSRTPQEKTSGGPLPGMRLNGRAVEARSAVLRGLASWAGLVAGERTLTAPRRTVPALAMFLEHHLDWLCRHPAAADFSYELGRLERAARRIASPAQPRRVPVGRCVEPGCPGTLSTTVDTGRSEGRGIRCDAVPEHRWEEHQWLHLRERMRQPGHPGQSAHGGNHPPRWLSPQAVSRLWGIPSGSVYRLASQHQWERHRKDGRTYYAEADVRRTLSHRKDSRTER
ncbi:hypothetical protein ACWC2K_09420 [Streptomyces chattanoogensis]|uniref:hypothetical protein n=1 Tax=Streptomyces chattanoogensis TaxID=66876 RepID=UPI00368FEF98